MSDYNPMRGIVYGVLISVVLFWLPLFYILTH